MDDMQRSSGSINPLYLQTRKVVVSFEFPGDTITVKEVLTKFSEEAKDHLSSIHIRDRREEHF